MSTPLPISILDPSVTGNRTKGGCHRYKHGIRAAFRATAFLSLVAVFYVYNYFKDGVGFESLDNNGKGEDITNQGRYLAGIFQKEADPKWLLVPYILGILYLFLGLAIVCDEFFVPALEVMVDENHLNLSMDIAGATLMAAGGSAPELFTSIIGTFQKSEVGIGTIVGSAVFNVLFVIGMCSFFSKEVLQLTWWPLVRDCSYYAVGLLVLAIFIGVISKNEIELWEALILFAMYFGYVFVMAFNEKLYNMITGKKLVGEPNIEEDKTLTSPISFQYPHTFRAGLLTFIRDSETWQAKARLGFLYGISGNVDEVFIRVDKNNDGHIDKDELKECFDGLNTPMDAEELDNIMQEIDNDNDGKVTKPEFKVWYLDSEETMKNKIEPVFSRFDSDKSGTITKDEFICMIQDVDPTASDDYKDEAAKACFDDKQIQALSFSEFSNWYFNSILYERQQENIQKLEQDDGICSKLCPPAGATFFGILKWIILFPLVASLSLTIPDSSKPSLNKWCFLSFFLSISWIGVYSYFMVGFAETIGETVGIPTFIMGLTFLAAGTSVPDLLSSVIVARMGEGDMAVSSSIGSNIFDILVGLPFPWILFCIWPNDEKVVNIGADGIWSSILILLGMIVLIIATIHLQGWKLTKMLGYVMFFFYFLFLLQAILQEYAF